MNWRLSIVLLAGALAGLGGATPAAAQMLTSGALEGVVQDSAGVAVYDAMISIIDPVTGVARTITSRRNGQFRAALLPTGDYDLAVEAFGYLPATIRGVPVRPGQKVVVPVLLATAEGPVEQRTVTQFGASPVSGTRPGVGQWVSAGAIRKLPFRHREMTQLARLSTQANADLNVEGLPARLSSVAADGFLVSPVRHPFLEDAPAIAAAFPLAQLSNAELLTNPVDVQWSRFAGGVLNAHTRRGGRDLQVDGSGAWAGEALHSGEQPGEFAADRVDLLGSVVVSGAIVPDTASFMVGVDAARLDGLPLGSGVFPDGEALRLASEGLGVPPGALLAQGARHERISAFGRFDWQLAADHSLAVRANGASLPATPAPFNGRSRALSLAAEGNDFAGALAISSVLGDETSNELRAGFELSSRSYLDPVSAAGTGSAALPGTRFTDSGAGIGPAPGSEGDFERNTFHLDETLHYRTGSHELKGGADVVFSSYSYDSAPGSEFFFGGADEFAARRGAVVQVAGPLAIADFSTTQLGLYGQDRWSPVPGVEFMLGLRYEFESRPVSEIIPNEALRVSTGLLNTPAETNRRKLSPRLGLVWDVREEHEWLIRAAAGMYHDIADPAVLAEVISTSTGQTIRRSVGNLGNWPEPAGEGLLNGTRITLLGPGFDAPRTSRGSLGVSRVLGPLASLHLSATVRKTEFLARRSNINQLEGTIGTDQFGRPLFGELIQVGGVLAAAPGSNRRFSNFDAIYAINADGESDYWGVTATLERQAIGPLDFFASYTFSETTDNLVGARNGTPGARLDPFAGVGPRGAWAEGRSDFDIPHRAVVAGELVLPAPFAPSLGAIYRYRSGYPFTPGFRTGVDANGDGSFRNDPAFVDQGIPGTAEVLGRWDCLRQSPAGVVARNACRAPGVHALDLRLGADLLASGSARASVFIEALDLIGSDRGFRDEALYLVDPSRSLVRDGVTGDVQVPLVANPRFGELFGPDFSARTLRIGLQVSY